MKHTVAVGIPFMASRYTKALELCLLSIQRYMPQVTEVYLQLDITNKTLLDSFDSEPITRIMPQIHIRRYERSRSGDYKQALIEWVLSQTQAEYAIIMHSDVFFWNYDVYDHLILPLVNDPGQMFCCWKTPITEYKSTFHKSAEAAKNFWVAPRVATWLFSLRTKAFQNPDLDSSVFWRGHYWIRKGILGEIPVDVSSFWSWFEPHNTEDIRSARKDCLIDIGTFFRMQWDLGTISGVCLGALENPSFSSFDFFYHKQGFVHIEQYDPERFNNQFYAKQMLIERTNLIENILRKEYGV